MLTFSFCLCLSKNGWNLNKANALGTISLVGMRQIAAAILLRLSFEGSGSCKKYLSFTQSKVGQKILWIWICPKINVYFQGALPKEPSSLVGFPRLNQKLCRTKLSWLLHGKRMGPPTFCTFDCPFMALQQLFIDNQLICESCYVHFPKWWLPVTLINSHWPINTPKKVWLPNLFVGCDSKSNPIHIFILLDSLQEAPVNLFYPTVLELWL